MSPSLPLLPPPFYQPITVPLHLHHLLAIPSPSLPITLPRLPIYPPSFLPFFLPSFLPSFLSSFLPPIFLFFLPPPGLFLYTNEDCFYSNLYSESGVEEKEEEEEEEEEKEMKEEEEVENG